MVWLIWLSACQHHDDAAETGQNERPASNVLIILVDDVGIDKIASYGVGVPGPATPTIDRLAAEGVRFQNAWAYPTCSPTRAALLTGRQVRRYGIGDWIEPWTDLARLPDEEITLPEMLRAAPEPWDSSLVGKWHLTTFVGDEAAVRNAPADQGFAWHAGTLGNLDNIAGPERPADPGYYAWEKDTNGVLAIEQQYVTSDTTDDGIARMEAMPEPWLLFASYNAVHTPLAPPPPELVPELTIDSKITLFDAITQATDREIGRLLDALPARTELPTTVILLADNGTPIADTDPSLDGRGGKGSPYELGVRVPMIVTSPLVSAPGRTEDALVHVLDLFATIADIAGVDLSALSGAGGAPLEHDSVSLLPYLADPNASNGRDLLFSEAFWPNGPPPYDVSKIAVRSRDLKYVRNRDLEEFYTFGPDGLEDRLLLGTTLSPEHQRALDDMRAFADASAARPFEYTAR